MRTVGVVAAVLTLVPLAGARAASELPYVPRNNPGRVQSVVDDFRTRLGMPHEVTVAVVPTNVLLASVEAIPDRKGAFLLSFEDGFLDDLDDQDLGAVVAHELGHVWIFTHHPYLQTERLANQIAMRLVSRDSLRRIYGKVWEHRGTKGDLTRFLGE